MEDNTNHGIKQLPTEIHKKNLKVQTQQKVHQKQDKDENKKRATLTFCSPNIRKLANLLKHTNINIAIKSTNTIQQHTKPKTLDKNLDYNISGIYKLTCNTCKMSYIGQTSTNLNQRYREHICYLRNNDPQHNDAAQSVGLLWTSDQLVAETSA
jgi:hypothetical protein